MLTATGALTYTWTGNIIANTLTINPAQTTTYVVTGKDANCSANFVLTQNVSICAGVKKSAGPVSNFVIYPNPSKGEFSVVSSKAIYLNIINELGQIVRLLSLDKSNEYKVSVHGLSKGIYFITGEGDSKITNQKLIISE